MTTFQHLLSRILSTDWSGETLIQRVLVTDHLHTDRDNVVIMRATYTTEKETFTQTTKIPLSRIIEQQINEKS